MAVGLTPPGKLDSISGIQLATAASGIKSSGALDLLVLSICEGASVAGVFTNNRYCAAPVTIARENLANARIRGLLINSGNANAGTGVEGEAVARELCRKLAMQLDVAANQILPFSTGVIGEQLPSESMTVAIESMTGSLNEDHWLSASEAIMTTDTVPKAVSASIAVNNVPVTITGISKGSGMIHPNMATMLSFVATDAQVDQQALQRAVATIADKTFNCITVDGDTSTNDAFICIASGTAEHQVLNENHPDWARFVDALEQVARTLAHAIVRDGEGATRFISISVVQGASRADCREVGLTVAHSPLVKTAFFAGDPNLGRILAAVGRSRIDDLDMSRVSVSLGSLPVVEHGEPSAQYNEERAFEIMAAEDVDVEISLGSGTESATVWTADLSYDYVKINAEYRS
jgi:glutamate N-acetyltransferase/amino-acid N-acetyltransferase